MTGFRPTFVMTSTAALIAAGCASSAPSPIDYRVGGPTVAPEVRMAPSTAPRPPAAVVTVPPAGGLAAAARPSSSPAVQEAAALAPETGSRPGGAMRQPREPAGGATITVMRGDTVYDMSQRNGVNMRALIEANGLQPPYALNVGQKLRLPPPNIHVIERGETLYSVSRRYNVDTRSLAVMNGLQRPWRVWPGDELLLPAMAATMIATRPVGQPVASPLETLAGSPPSTPSVKPVTAARPVQVASASGSQAAGPIALGPDPARTTMSVSASAPSAGMFMWPATGPVLAGFGVGPDGTRNDGVNIALEPGTEIRASAAGDVVYAGDELAGFGNLLLVRHAEGWVTAYAHAERLLVGEGDKVAQGQAIALAGATGSASRPQVHFELRRGKDPVDPALFLPK